MRVPTGHCFRRNASISRFTFILNSSHRLCVIFQLTGVFLTKKVKQDVIDNTLAKLKNGYRIDAFLWHQGESDRAYGDKYYENLKAVVAYVRNHLSEKTGEDYSKLPFIFGTVAKKNKQYGSEVEEAMKRLAKEDKNAYLIDMSDAELMGDRLHFNQNSAEYLGKQMYEQIKKLR